MGKCFFDIGLLYIQRAGHKKARPKDLEPSSRATQFKKLLPRVVFKFWFGRLSFPFHFEAILTDGPGL